MSVDPKVQAAASPLATDGMWRWEHAGEQYAIKFPSCRDDMRINALRARLDSVHSDVYTTDPLAGFFMEDLSVSVATLDVCLTEHPESFTQVTGRIVPWRVSNGTGRGALNADELQDYPELRGLSLKPNEPGPLLRHESAWTRAVREVRAFRTFFRFDPFRADLGGGPAPIRENGVESDGSQATGPVGSGGTQPTPG